MEDGPHVVVVNYGVSWETIDIKVVGNFRSEAVAQSWIAKQEADAEAVGVKQFAAMPLRDPDEGITDWLHKPAEKVEER